MSADERLPTYGPPPHDPREDRPSAWWGGALVGAGILLAALGGTYALPLLSDMAEDAPIPRSMFLSRGDGALIWLTIALVGLILAHVGSRIILRKMR